VVAPVGTVAVIWVEEFTVKVAEALLNLTSVVPVKFVPVIVTTVPTGPLVGEKEVMVGDPGAVTVNHSELVAVPFGVVTEMGPLMAPEGTVAVIRVEESTVKVAEVFLNFTSVAPVKLVPTMVTAVPTGPLIGEKDVMVGAGVAAPAAGTAGPARSRATTRKPDTRIPVRASGRLMVVSSQRVHHGLYSPPERGCNLQMG